MASLTSTPAKGKHKRRHPALHIDMTPMVDLAFLLLTFFIMTTTLSKQPAMEIQQPASDGAGNHTEVEAKEVLNLILGKDNRVYWYMGKPGGETNITDYSRSGIRALLITKKAEIPDLYVFIKASDQSRYQNMVDVLDEIMITRVRNYSLVALDPQDQALIN